MSAFSQTVPCDNEQFFKLMTFIPHSQIILQRLDISTAAMLQVIGFFLVYATKTFGSFHTAACIYSQVKISLSLDFPLITPISTVSLLAEMGLIFASTIIQ